MSDTFITADEHYGHNFIREVKQRPFADTNEMDEAMIARHNAKVPDSKSYLTIHNGDMIWQTIPVMRAQLILARLHGRHALVLGNHDKLVQNNPILSNMFEWVRHAHLLHFNKHKLTIYHYAQRVWNGSHKGHWHVYGHSHQELPPLGLSFDVGVEGHDYEPWSLEEIEKKMSTLAQHHVITKENVWPGKYIG